MSNPNTVHEDISYMRRLVEQGRSGTILGGAFLAAAGIVFGITCFVQTAAQQGLLAISDREMYWLWGGVSTVYLVVVWPVVYFRVRSQGRAGSNASNAVFGIAWIANAVGVLMAYGTTLVVTSATKTPIVLTSFVPMIFTFYGIAWGLSGLMARRHWMYAPAVASFVMAFVMAVLTATPYQVPVMGAALIVLLTLPGFKLMSEEPK
ncbi:MAG: hypothetical protein KGJ79_07270 [Alphaproteobacteria bacterium]|nr:hypothetical protein [Alphaproteobacteria bacterium]MDE2110925.1 hypothetical protein [Alphaproteobacteria bacterium]MDE2495408.1 hypothetical protein [Alphaproteobacteria bacterium]